MKRFYRKQMQKKMNDENNDDVTDVNMVSGF